MNNLSFSSFLPKMLSLLSLLFLLFFSPSLNAQVLSFDDFGIEPNENGEYGGALELTLFGTNIQLDAPLVTDKNDLRFNGKLEEKISIQDFLKGVGGDNFYNEINIAPVNSILSKIDLPAFSFSVYPVAKKFSIENTGGTGFALQKVDGDYIFTLSYAPENGLKFADIESNLSIIDDINFVDQLKLIISNDDGGKKGAVKLAAVGEIQKSTLLGKIKKVDPSNYLKLQDVINELPSLTFEGSFDKNYNSTLIAAAKVNKNITNNLKFEGLGIDLKYKSPKTLDLGIDGSGILKIDGTNLRFNLGLIGEPSSASMGGKFGLTSLDANNNPIEWYEPFGIPYISFETVRGALSLSGTTVIDKVSVEVAMRLGEKAAADKRIEGDIKLDLDVNDPINSSYDANLKNFNLLKMIEAFDNDISIPSEMKTVLDIGVNHAKINLDPKNSAAKIEGDLSFFDFIDGHIGIGINPSSGAQFAGSLEPINFSPGGIDILSIHSKGNSNKGAGFNIKLESEPVIELTGEMEILGITGSKAKMRIDKNGLNVTTGVDFVGLMKGDLTVKGLGFSNSNLLNVSGNLKPTFADISKEIEKYIKEYGGAAAGEVVGFLLNDVFMVNSISVNSNIATTSTKLNLKVNYTAIGSNYSFNLPVDLDFSEPENIPETIATLTATLAEQIIYNSGDLLLKVLEEGLKLAEDAVKEVGKVAEAAVKELDKIVNDPVGTLNEYSREIEDFVNPQKTFPKAESGTAEPNVKPGYRRYMIRMTVSQRDGATNKYYGITGLILHKSKYSSLDLTRHKGDQANAYYSKNTNTILASADERRPYIINGTVGTAGTKFFYAKHSEDITLYIYNKYWKKNATIFVKDNAMDFSRKVVNLSSLPDGMKTIKVDGPNGLTVTYYITAAQMMTKEVLIAAINRNDFTVLKDKIRKGGDLQAIQKDAMTAAVKVKNDEIISYLVKKFNTKTTTAHLDAACTPEADPNFVWLVLKHLDRNQRPTAKHITYAFDKNALWLVKEMLDRGAKPNNKNLSQALIKSYPLAKRIRTENRNLAPTESDLTAVVSRSNLPSTKLIIEDVSPKESHFSTAASANKTEIFQVLYNKDKEVIKSVVPARIAINNKNMDILRMALNKTITPDKIVVYAMSQNYMDGITYCLQMGVDPKPALLKAIEGPENESPNMTIIRAIVDDNLYKDKINLEESEYLSTAVLYAREGSHDEMVKLLLDRGANPNLYKDPKTGHTLLHLTSMVRRKRPGHTDDMGKPKVEQSLNEILTKNKRAHVIVELLVKHGADLNAKDMDGFTPLHYAVNKANKEESFKMVKMMVEAGADVKAVNNKGQSVLKLADGKQVKEYLKQF